LTCTAESGVHPRVSRRARDRLGMKRGREGGALMSGAAVRETVGFA
jgi:hypothetical protein